MKKLLTKLVIGFTFISLACLYSGGAMAMNSKMTMNMSKDEHCTHCYFQESSTCDYNEAIIPSQSSDDDFDGPTSNDYGFRPDSLHANKISQQDLIHRPPDQDKFIPPPFINSNIVLLI